MEQELLEYLETRFTRLDDKLDGCAKQTDMKDVLTRVSSLEGAVKSHSLIFMVTGALGLSSFGVWLKHWLGK